MKTNDQEPDPKAKRAPAKSDYATCRICGQPKKPRNFCCRSCYQRLPREFRAGFATLKLRSLAWLRQNPARAPVGYPQTQADRELDDDLDADALRSNPDAEYDAIEMDERRAGCSTVGVQSGKHEGRADGCTLITNAGSQGIESKIDS
jgi:hypothetical protein